MENYYADVMDMDTDDLDSKLEEMAKELKLEEVTIDMMFQK